MTIPQCNTLFLITGSITDDTGRVDFETCQKYLGRYSMPGLAEIEIKFLDGKMVAAYPETPGFFTRLVPVGGHQFRMQGGLANGEIARFQLSEKGDVICLRLGSYILERK